MDRIEIRIVRTGESVEVIDAEGRTSEQLCMGECLEQVLGLIYPETRKVYPMRTPAEWQAMRDEWAKRNHDTIIQE